MAKVRLRDLDPAKFLNNLEVDGAGEFGGRLDVNHDTVKLYNSENTNNTYFFVENTSIGNAGVKMKNSQGEWTIIANDRLRFISDDSPTTEVLSLYPNGNVGIGTGSDTPSRLLELSADTNSTVNLLGLRNADSTYSQTVDFSLDTSKDLVIAGSSSNGGIHFNMGSRGYTFSNGNVGIGMTPGSTYGLYVSGKPVKFISNGSASNGSVLELVHANNDSTDVVGTLTFANNVGAVAHIRGGTTDGNTNGYISFFTDDAGTSSERMTISHDGKLFVGGEIMGSAAIAQFNGFIRLTQGLYISDASTAGNYVGWEIVENSLVTQAAGDARHRIGIGTKSNKPNEILHVVSAGSGSSGYNNAETRGILITDNVGPRVVLEDISEGVDNKVMSLRNEDQCFKIASMSDNGNAYDSNNILVAHRDGHVGIGVVPSSIGANVAVLNVNGGGLFNASVCLRYGFTNSNYSLFQTNGQTLTISNVGTGTGTGDGHIILNTSRNVGVGAFAGTEPEYNLHVEGTLYANTISVGSGFNNLINAGQLTSRKNSSGQTADTDAALVIEQNVNPILEFLTGGGGNGTINFSDNTKGVAAIKVELPDKMQFWAGETLQLTLNQGGSNNVTFSRLGAGTVQSDADGNLSVSSSAALKTEVRDFTGGLSSINNLRPVKFKWKQDTGLDYHNDYVGFIAEEVEEELPDAVLCPSECCDNDEMVENHKSKGLSDRTMIAALVNAVQELSTRVQQLENN